LDFLVRTLQNILAGLDGSGSGPENFVNTVGKLQYTDFCFIYDMLQKSDVFGAALLKNGAKIDSTPND
jgi:hypothetical protein